VSYRKCSECIYLSDEFAYCIKYKLPIKKVKLIICAKQFTFDNVAETLEKLKQVKEWFDGIEPTLKECLPHSYNALKKTLEGETNG